MPNLPGPYELEFTYEPQASGVSRVLRVQCNAPAPITLGTPFASATLLKKNGGSVDAQTAADLLWSFLRLGWNAGTICTGVTLWKYVTGTYAKDFVSASAVATPTGAGGGSVARQQEVLSFRSANGGILKIQMMEAANSGSQQVPLVPNPTGAYHQRIASYILSGDSIVIARDNGFAIAALRQSLGENEKLWQNSFRP